MDPQTNPKPQPPNPNLPDVQPVGDPPPLGQPPLPDGIKPQQGDGTPGNAQQQGDPKHVGALNSPSGPTVVETGVLLPTPAEPAAKDKVE